MNALEIFLQRPHGASPCAPGSEDARFACWQIFALAKDTGLADINVGTHTFTITVRATSHPETAWSGRHTDRERRTRVKAR